MSDTNSGARPADQALVSDEAQLHGLHPPGFDPSRGQASLNVTAGLFLDSDGSLYPVTKWLDEDGDECPRDSAAMCVAGRDGCWFSLLLADFNEEPARA